MPNLNVPTASISVIGKVPRIAPKPWFPVAPSITVLPPTPAIVNGSMSFGTLLPLWDERLLLEGRVRVGVGVQRLDYSTTVQTVVPSIRTRTGLSVSRILKVDVPAGSVAVAGEVPAVSLGAAVRPPAAAIAVDGEAPAVMVSIVVQVPAADVAVAGEVPAVSATLTTVSVPAADITVAGATPDIQAGDDYYSNLAAQVFTLLRDWRVDWWGD